MDACLETKLYTCPNCYCPKPKSDYAAMDVRTTSICIGCLLQRKSDSQRRKKRGYELSNLFKREYKNDLLKKSRLRNLDHARKRRREYEIKRRQSDKFYKFTCNVRNLINQSFFKFGHLKSDKSENILGCTLSEFRNYIQSLFKDGMSFDNKSEWHLDHIIPLASAKTEDEIYKLCHYTNFQPLWKSENLKKGKKILHEQEI